MKDINPNHEKIAIIGMSCRFPQASNPEHYWQMLSREVNAISKIPADRWNAEFFYDDDPGTPGKMNTLWGGFIEHPYAFDFSFFNLSKRQASKWDPQHRWLLETSWEAFESAGLTLEDLKQMQGGVYAGIGNHDYAFARIIDAKQTIGDFSEADIYTTMGNDISVALNRLSRFYHLKGPALAFNSDCSSALVATDVACQHLEQGMIDVALVGGVCFTGSPIQSIGLSQAWLISSGDQCKSFDQDADGYVLSEGHGFLVLKRLSDALRDGNTVLGVILGSAVNADCVHQEMVQPSAESMVDVMKQALQKARIDADQIEYIEGHGVASPKADEAELQSLMQLFNNPKKEQVCWISTAKSNLGHLQWASGIASMIKVLLAFRYELITPVLHYHRAIYPPLEQASSLKMATQMTDWKRSSHRKRLAGVNSFGLGGTNAHIILEEGREERPEFKPLPYHLLLLSSPSSKAILPLARLYGEYIQNQPEEDLGNICYSLNAGRNVFAYRTVLFAKTKQDLLDHLDQVEEPDGPVSKPALTWMFTGQGSQFAGMGKALYETQPLFKKALDACVQIANPLLNDSLLDVMFSDQEKLNQTLFTQPALFSIEYALAQLWISWGITPDVVMGHSLGEYVAACVAGLWSLEDALSIVVKRAQLIDSLPRDGGMLAVSAAASLLEEKGLLPESVGVASYNAPEQFVLSGPKKDLEEIALKLDQKEISYKFLNVSHAFHSSLMEPILEEFEKFIETKRFNQPFIPILSNVTGSIGQAEMLKASYWRQHIRRPVQFQLSLQTLYRRGHSAFLEIGPQPILTTLAMASLQDEDNETLLWLYSMKKNKAESFQMGDTLAKLGQKGFTIDWKAFYSPYAYRHDPFAPTYPFQREKVDSKNIPDLSYQSISPAKAEFSEPLLTKLPDSILKREAALKEIIRSRLVNLLKKDPAIMMDETSFADLGLSSLMGIELMNELRQEIDHPLKLTPAILFDHSSIAKLSHYLAREGTEHALEHQKPSYRDIQLKWPKNLQIDFAACKEQPPPKNLLITGVTGFVAPYLIADLHKQDQNLKFYCLVRAPSLEDARQRIEKNFKEKKLFSQKFGEALIPILGDFSEPFLGLDEATYQQLGSDIDQVYHVGAQVNFIYSFEKLYQPNVQGTQEIIDFCLSKKIKFLHHISTVGVFPIFYHRLLEIEETDELQPSWKLDLGYGQTKYAAEQLVKQAQNKGLPANIYRLGIIGGVAENGDWFSEDTFPQLLKGCLELGAVPSSTNIAFSVTPVDAIAQAICDLAKKHKSQKGIYHILNDQQTSLDEILHTLSQTFHLKTQDKWSWLHDLKNLAKKQPKHVLTAHLPFFDFLYQASEHSFFSTKFLTQQTQSHLNPSLFNGFHIKPETWHKYFNFIYSSLKEERK